MAAWRTRELSHRLANLRDGRSVWVRSGAADQGRRSAQTIERLPPVTSQWPGVPVSSVTPGLWTSPLPSPWTTIFCRRAKPRWRRPPRNPRRNPPSKKEGDKEGGEEKKDGAKPVPDIKGDPLPRMLESVVIERTPWYHMDFPWLNPWDGSFEMGMDGSAATATRSTSGWDSRRNEKRNAILSMDLDYHRTRTTRWRPPIGSISKGDTSELSEVTPGPGSPGNHRLRRVSAVGRSRGRVDGPGLPVHR